MTTAAVVRISLSIYLILSDSNVGHIIRSVFNCFHSSL